MHRAFVFHPIRRELRIGRLVSWSEWSSFTEIESLEWMEQCIEDIGSKRGFNERQWYNVLVKQVIEHHNMLVRAALVPLRQTKQDAP